MHMVCSLRRYGAPTPGANAAEGLPANVRRFGANLRLARLADWLTACGHHVA